MEDKDSFSGLKPYPLRSQSKCDSLSSSSTKLTLLLGSKGQENVKKSEQACSKQQILNYSVTRKRAMSML